MSVNEPGRCVNAASSHFVDRHKEKQGWEIDKRGKEYESRYGIDFRALDFRCGAVSQKECAGDQECRAKNGGACKVHGTDKADAGQSEACRE